MKLPSRSPVPAVRLAARWFASAVIVLMCVSIVRSVSAQSIDILTKTATAFATEAVTRKSGGAAIADKDWTSAERHYRTLVDAGSKDSDDYRWLGFALVRQERSAEAITYFERAVEIAPNNSQHWNRLCWQRTWSTRSPTHKWHARRRTRLMMQTGQLPSIWATPIYSKVTAR